MTSTQPNQHLTGVPKDARSFQGKPAGLVTRLMSTVVDVLIVLAMLAGVFLGANAVALAINPLGFTPVTVPLGITLIVGVVISVLYLMVSWIWTGRTVGAALLGIRVVDFGSERLLGPVRALVRAVACALFPIGLAWVLVSPGRRSLHDRLVGSVVLYKWTVR